MGVLADSESETRAADSHDFRVRVYYEDTDAQGIVYFANYLRYMERGRTEWLRARGVDQSALSREHGLCFSLTNTAVQFRKPAVFDDELVVRTTVTKLSGARVGFRQDIFRGSAAGDLLCTGECEAACLDVATLKPRRLPRGLL